MEALILCLKIFLFVSFVTRVWNVDGGGGVSVMTLRTRKGKQKSESEYKNYT
jgi:hypothetical protein